MGRFWVKPLAKTNIDKLFGLTEKSGKMKNMAKFWQKKIEKTKICNFEIMRKKRKISFINIERND